MQVIDAAANEVPCRGTRGRSGASERHLRRSLTFEILTETLRQTAHSAVQLPAYTAAGHVLWRGGSGVAADPDLWPGFEPRI